MDYTPVLQPLFTALWYLIPLAILAGVVKSPWFKGKVGEFVVNASARLFLDKHRYHLIKNVTLPTEDGTTQIDHIIVSQYGVFVVETKNMKGWISGKPNQRYWTQKIFKHSQKFQNPLHQNYKHVKTLLSLLGLSDQQVHSLVVFVGDSTFKTEMPTNVTQGGGYLRFIKSHSEELLSEAEVREVVEKVESGRLAASIRTNREHVAHVREIVARKENEPQCPKCRGEMVKRTVKRGDNAGKEFLGCKAFPKCRGVVDSALL
ncbi:MAG: NERD domain-containing protein [Pseudomonadales bacterium]|nr:NERD domain-containing protein [Pseudomonadales bacterium]